LRYRSVGVPFWRPSRTFRLASGLLRFALFLVDFRDGRPFVLSSNA
jgi:hypothetical protein